MSNRALIEQILDHKNFAVTGVSRDKEKYGYKVYAINPNAETIDNDPCYPSLDNVPEPIDCLVTVTPPAITEETLHQAGRLRVPFVWMQPGSESTAAHNLAFSFAMQIVSGGPCIMVAAAQHQAREK